MISKRHKVIFVHVPKTAGQSVERAFLEDLGMTWEERAPLILKPNVERMLGPERLAHLFAHEYRDLGYVTETEFDQFFKFAIVRNPYDRAVSEYNFRPRSASFGTVRDFFKSIKDDSHLDAWRHICPQVRYLADPETGAFLVDDIWRFEQLGDHWGNTMKGVFGRSVALPRSNASTPRLAREDMSPEDIDFINEAYEADFTAFGYSMI